MFSSYSLEIDLLDATHVCNDLTHALCYLMGSPCLRSCDRINLVNWRGIKKETYINDCIKLNTWRLNSVNESHIIKELINEPSATANTIYIYKIKTKELAQNEMKENYY